MNLGSNPYVLGSGDSVALSNTDSANNVIHQSEVVDQSRPLPEASDASMEEYYQLQQNLLLVTLIFSGIIFLSVWWAYSLGVALNYLIGACTGVVYLRMLAKNVANLGRGQSKISSSRLALFIGLILVATQWQQLEIVPVFLGFLTYKVALIAYVLWTVILPE
jgi:ATP synthase protein I